MGRIITGLIGLVCGAMVVVAALALYQTMSTTLTTRTLTVHDVSLQQAINVANAAIDECKKTESTISVVVVSQSGEIRLAVRGTGASPDQLDEAHRKAYTARTFRRTTADWGKGTTPDQPQAGQRKLEGVDPDAGGVPIMFDGAAIGGIGVAGSKGGPKTDEACAKAGVAKISSELL